MARRLRVRILAVAAIASFLLITAAAVVVVENTAGLFAASVTLSISGLATLALTGWIGVLRATQRARRAEQLAISNREGNADVTLRDPVTGLGNHRLFDAMLRVEFARAQRYGYPFALLLVEADAGTARHATDRAAAQERLLTFLARVLSQNLREADLSARLTDSMFGVVLRDTEYEAARAVWERLRVTALSHWPEDRAWTISGGAAAYTIEVSRVDEMVADADRRLAMEKRRLRAEPET